MRKNRSTLPREGESKGSECSKVQPMRAQASARWREVKAGPLSRVEALGHAVGGDRVAEGVQQIGVSSGKAKPAPTSTRQWSSMMAQRMALRLPFWAWTRGPCMKSATHRSLGCGISYLARALPGPRGLGQAAGLEQPSQRRLADAPALGQDAVVVQDLPEQLDRSRGGAGPGGGR